MNESKVRATFFVLLPVFPLLDFFAPYKVPYLSILVYIAMIGMFWSREFEYYFLLIAYIIVNILSVVFCTILYGLKSEQIYYILVMLTFFILGVGIGVKEKYYINWLYKMVLMYFCINTSIYFFRLIQYGFDFSRVRGGITIYGGNSAHFIYLTMLFLLKKYKEKREQYYLILGICVINSIMFVSKGAMVITFLWIVMDVINFQESKILSRRNIIIGFLAIILIVIVSCFKTNFLSYIISRFAIWRNSYQLSGSIMGERGLIFRDTLMYLKENPNSFFLGVGPTNYKMVNPWSYSNPHNLFLDIFVNTGFLSLLFFSSIVIKTLWNIRYKFYYALCVIYATLEGISLFFVDAESRIVTGYAFMFLIIIYISSWNHCLSGRKSGNL